MTIYSPTSSPSASSSDKLSTSPLSSLLSDLSSSLVSSQALPLPFQLPWSANLCISQANQSILPLSCANSLVLQSIITTTSLSHWSKTCVTGSSHINGPATENPPNASSISSMLAASATAFLILLHFSPPHGDIVTMVGNASLSLCFSLLANLFIVTIDTSR